MKGFKKVWLLSVASVLAAGCALDKVDECPDNPMRDEPGICGCAALTPDYVDADGDGTPDCIDKCIDDPNKIEPGECGCGNPEVAGCGKPEDKCPDDPNKTEPGNCGCGKPEVEGCGEVVDNCPDDPDKTEPGNCGCGKPEVEGCGEDVDNCPDDPDKTEPGNCGCGKPEIEGCGEVVDNCPDDPDKTEPGVCGCGNADGDSDSDGTMDCNDNCPDDPNKTEPGECGCGTADDDSDSDGTFDCKDNCPSDPNKTEPGECGCDVPESAGCGKFDADDDGLEDAQDPCPTNPDTTLTLNDCKVVNEVEHTATIRHAFDLYTLRDSLAKDSKHDTVWKVTVVNDLNFGYVNMNGLADKIGMKSPLQIGDDGSCTIHSPAISLINVNFDGKDKTITAVYQDKACSLDNALFDVIKTMYSKTAGESIVDDLKVHLDVNGEAHALFANEIRGNVTINNVSVKGKLTTTVTENVGGLAGMMTYTTNQSSVYISTLNNCYADGVSIDAPAADYVGGLIGDFRRGTVRMKTTTRTTSVVGKDHVGGVIGLLEYGNPGVTSIVGMEGAISSVAGTVEGNQYVGGFVGASQRYKFENIRNRVTTVKATGDYVGGFAGHVGGYQKNGGQLLNIASYVESVEAPGSNAVGGLVGGGGS